MKKFFLIFVLGLFASNLSLAAETYGLVMVAKGQVSVQKNGAGTFETLKVGNKVYPGDMLKTAADSRAKIVMSDRNILNLAPDTVLVIAKYVNNSDKGSNDKSAELLMLQGKVRAKVEEKYEKANQGFQIKTPTAVAGVRGTEFFVNYNLQTRTTDVFVTSGTVNIAPLVTSAATAPTAQSLSQAQVDTSNQVPVEKNQTSSVSQNAAPTAPRTFSSQEMNSIKLDVQETGKSSDGGGGASPSTDAKTNKKEMVTKDMVGSGAIRNDTQLNQDIKAPAPGIPTGLPTTQIQPPPLPPTPPPAVSDIIQNQNKNSNVTIQPTK